MCIYMCMVTFTYMHEYNYRHIDLFAYTSKAFVHPFFISNFNQVYIYCLLGFSFTHTYYICIFIYKFNYIHPDCSRFFWIESFRFWEILGERCSFYLDGLQWAAENEIGGASPLIAFSMIVFMHVYTLFMKIYYVNKCVQIMFVLFIYVWW